jgi:hypothetical protein
VIRKPLQAPYGGLAGAGEARYDDEAVAGEVEVDVEEPEVPSRLCSRAPRMMSFSIGRG